MDQKTSNNTLWGKIKEFSVFKFFFTDNDKLIEDRVVNKPVEKNNEEILRCIETYKKFNSFSIKILDTSTLLKGSFVSLIESGFIDGFLYIPSFILKEAHILSDSKNHFARQKGKTILNNIILLKNRNKCFIGDVNNKAINEEADYLLMKFAFYINKKTTYVSKVITSDNNLASLCSLNRIPVLNINKFLFIVNQDVRQGDKIEVHLASKGDKDNQARGNTKDGTMVVVENASNYIHRDIVAVVKRVWVTEHTRIIFCNFLQLKRV